MKVREIMSSDPVTCTPDDTLNRASELMWNRDIGCLPVVDGERRVVGMVTDRDVCMSGYTQNRPQSELNVRLAMSGQASTCSPDDSVEAAERTMLEHQVRRLPVVDQDQHVLGVLSLNDLARACCAGLRRGKVGPRPDDLVRTLGAVCEPRSGAVATAEPTTERPAARELTISAHG